MRGSTPDSDLATLQETEAALDGPITALTPKAALGLVDHWRTACQDTDALDLSGVSAGLSELRDLLSGDALDGRAIADTMAALAEATRNAASAAPDERLMPRLERIAANLDRAAGLLGT